MVDADAKRLVSDAVLASSVRVVPSHEYKPNRASVKPLAADDDVAYEMLLTVTEYGDVKKLQNAVPVFGALVVVTIFRSTTSTTDVD